MNHTLPTLILMMLMSGQAMAGDWPQFHGPARNNTTTETGWRKDWPKDGPPVAWRVQVGAGMASFAVVGGHVFTAGNDGENQDTVWCLDLADGKVVWRHDYPCKSAAHVMPIVPGGPSATPCVGDGRVFSVSREGDVFCLEAATGKVLWQKSLLKDFHGQRPVYGYAGSPLLWQGKLFLDAGGDEGSTVCLDASNGTTLWAKGRGEAGYATPVMTTLGGKERLVMFKGRELAVLDPKDGSVIASHATTTTDFCNCATPMIGSDGTIFISHTGNDGSTGLRLDGTALTAAWNVRDLGLLYNSGVPWGKNALMIFNDSKRGVNDLRCLDLSTGRALWESAEVNKGTAILSDGHLIVLSTTGELQLCQPSDGGITVLSRAQVLEGKCWVLPVLSGKHLLCRNNAGEVVCLKVTE
ncbi:MAG TPA: PQQ-like beta-propeller repeat protein [Prosthecobacter sp.]|nr:PQQ-like beta-propeller repeat protein [Prosthecobacter sp.]